MVAVVMSLMRAVLTVTADSSPLWQLCKSDKTLKSVAGGWCVRCCDGILGSIIPNDCVNIFDKHQELQFSRTLRPAAAGRCR